MGEGEQSNGLGSAGKLAFGAMSITLQLDLPESLAEEARKAGLLTSGESDAVRFVGPIEPATKRGLSGVENALAARRAICAAARLMSYTNGSSA